MMSASEYLRDRGLKATAPRVAVLDVLIRMKHPGSVQDVMKALPKGSADQATVYRSLEAFVQHGVAHHVDLGKGPASYEFASEDHHHHHLICTTCGRIEDIDECAVDGIVKRILKDSSSFARVDSHSFELFGQCNECAKT